MNIWQRLCKLEKTVQQANCDHTKYGTYTFELSGHSVCLTHTCGRCDKFTHRDTRSKSLVEAAEKLRAFARNELEPLDE